MAPGVGKAPGAIATVRMPFGPHSTARLLVIASTADFAMADGTVKARPVMVEVDKMLSTTPAMSALDPALSRRERAIHRAV